jgi:hypothetical protein
MRWAALFFCCSAAWAHKGTVVSLAQFTQPPPLLTVPDAGTTIATADVSYDIAWVDSDSDPTGRYFFYYLDRPPPSGTTTAKVAAQATALPLGGIWAACDCIDGPMVMCPDAGVRDCRNGFTWDTSAVAPGAYWIVAVDNDPPYYLYSVSESPVRVGHGGSPPPGALFLAPNGIGSADQSYPVRWLAAGDAPFEFDLAWGKNVDPIGAPTAIGASIAAVDEGGGNFSYTWDTSQIPGGDIYVQLTVRDAQARSSVTNSANLRIFHPGSPDLGRPDMAVAKTPTRGCEVGGSDGAGTALFAGASLALLLWFLTRRSLS